MRRRSPSLRLFPSLLIPHRGRLAVIPLTVLLVVVSLGGMTPAASAVDADGPAPATVADPTGDDERDEPQEPADEPTGDPSTDPGEESSDEPTGDPSEDPSGDPTDDPSEEPTDDQTDDPSEEPTEDPTDEDAAEEKAEEKAEDSLVAAAALDADTPWGCPTDGLLFQGSTPTRVERINLVTGENPAPMLIAGRQINAVGYSVADDYVYGWDHETGQVVRVDANGDIDDLGGVPGVTTNAAIGDVDADGDYWFRTAGDWYEVRPQAASVQLLRTGQVGTPAGMSGGNDWAFVPGTGRFWSVFSNDAETESFLFGWSPETGWDAGRSLGNVGRPGSNNRTGAVFVDNAGLLYASYNFTGEIFVIDVRAATPTARKFSDGPSSGGSDGARCARAPIDVDFGDAPAGYGTNLAQDGARHGLPGLVPGTNRAPLMLGRRVDAEADGDPSLYAASDDDLGINDEDGLAVPARFEVGAVAAIRVEVTNDTGAAATLAGWLDSNDNGTFEAGERRTAAVPASGAPTTTTLAFPPNPAPGSHFLRLRLFPGSVADPQPTGPAAAGEVEDHLAVIRRPATSAWQCTPEAILFQSPGVEPRTRDYRINLVSGVPVEAPEIPGYRINAIGYNQADNFVYGWDTISRQLVRVGSDGGVTDLGVPTAADPADAIPTPAPVALTGDVDDNGHYWLEAGGRWYQIDLATRTILDAGPSARPDGGADWVYVPGTNRLWSVGNDLAGGTQSVLTSFDRTSRTWSAPVALGPLGGGPGTPQQVGAVFSDPDGYIYASYNQTGDIWRVDPRTNAAARFSGGPTAANNDGARCALARIPVDFADAPDTYGTSLAQDGARHAVDGLASGAAPLMLGGSLDLDTDGLPGPAAQGDDTTGADDEDAVPGGLQHVAGNPVAVPVTTTNTSGAGATLVGWLDGDGSGTFEPGERQVLPVAAGSGTATQTLTFPPVTTSADTYLRLRLFAGAPADPQPRGTAPGGEVEDHLVAATSPALTVTKTSDATADTRIGDTVTYTVTATNTGSAPYTAADPAVVEDDLAGVVDDAAFDPATASADRPGSIAYAAPVLSWSGALAVNDTVRITYRVIVTGAGDTVLRNAAGTPGCVRPSPSCPDPVIDRVPRPALDKSADRTSLPDGGETVNYAVVASNTGAGDYTPTRPLVVVDDLTDIVDDGTLVPGSVSVTPAGAGTIDVTGNRITWSGPLASGQAITIRYQVVYNATGDRDLTNLAFVTPCVPGSPGCAPPPTPQCVGNVDPVTGLPCDGVYIPGSRVTVAKTSTPPDGTTVLAGQDVTYTLTFDNDGPAAGNLSWTDYVGHLEDDAVIVAAPSSPTPGVVVSGVAGGAFTITGTIAPNSQATVTYTVRVRPDGQRGDHRLVNIVRRGVPTTPPPSICDPGDPLCTLHPVPEIVDSKSATPAPGTSVPAGTPVTYQLTFGNQGAAAGAVAKEDVVSDVLDDAVLVTPPTASDPALIVSPIAGGRFSVSGTLQPGQTVTVTYVVQVKPDAQRVADGGNDRLGNFLVLPGGNGQCPTTDPDSTCHGIPRIVDSKSATPASGTVVLPGQQVTFTLTFSNEGTGAGAVDKEDGAGGVLDDAVLVAPPAASDPALTVGAIGPDGRFRITGTLQPGQTVTVSYTVEVKPDEQRVADGGDDRLGNFLVPTGSTIPDCPVVDPDATCHGIPRIVDSKSATPASGTVVLPGDQVTYTLTFTNEGTGAGAVDQEDAVGSVLDDAVLVAPPTASDPALSVSAIGPDGRFRITGTLQPDQTVTVSYTVEVKPDEQRVADGGDHLLANFLVPTGSTVPDCPVVDPDATCHGIPLLLDSKSVAPASGTVVVEGEQLTYQLTFSNEGQGAGDLAREDDLSGVLDDATMVTPPTASDPALTLGAIGPDGRLSITGTLQPGQVVTVSYTVEVKPDEDRVADGGDDRLGNFLLDPGEQPGDCLPGDPDCTQNPIPRMVHRKSVRPSSGTVVSTGRVLTFTLTFTNEGTGAGDLERVDDLSHLLDDARLVSPPTSADPALTVSAVRAGRFTVSGVLQPDQTVRVTYQAQVRRAEQRGDDIIANYLLEDGPPPPTPECDAADPGCTLNPVSEIEARKDVRPDSGTQVAPGQRLTYRLRFTNTGQGTGAVRWDDDLSDVLDDATLVDGPDSDDAGVTATLAGRRIRVRGTLDRGETALVTYVVQVDGVRSGNGLLQNFLGVTGTEPPADCRPDSDLCTENPVEPPGPGLPDTGGPSVALLLLGGGLVVSGGAVLVGKRRQRRQEVA